MSQKLLNHEWDIWFTYKGGQNEYILKNMFSLKTTYDLAYLWNQSIIAHLEKTFAQHNFIQCKYLVNDKWRLINSILYFRKGIHPEWEDPKNQIGGYFVFSIPVSFAGKDQLYEGFVLYILGETFEYSQRVNGIRFVNSKEPDTIAYRIELWVDFRDDNIQCLQKYEAALKFIFQKYNFNCNDIRFENILKKMQKETHKTNKIS